MFLSKIALMGLKKKKRNHVKNNCPHITLKGWGRGNPGDEDGDSQRDLSVHSRGGGH